MDWFEASCYKICGEVPSLLEVQTRASIFFRIVTATQDSKMEVRKDNHGYYDWYVSDRDQEGCHWVDCRLPNKVFALLVVLMSYSL